MDTSHARTAVTLAAYFIELNLAQHPDPPEREFLVGLPTSLRLDREAVDRVIAAAATILHQSEGFKVFVRDMAALDGFPDAAPRLESGNAANP